jgi:hypothetical protein
MTDTLTAFGRVTTNLVFSAHAGPAAAAGRRMIDHSPG